MVHEKGRRSLIISLVYMKEKSQIKARCKKRKVNYQIVTQKKERRSNQEKKRKLTRKLEFSQEPKESALERSRQKNK